MDYFLLSEEDRLQLRAQHTFDLEARLFTLCLHEEEEPGRSPERVRSITELADRIARHRAILAPTLDADHEPEPSAHGEDGPGV